MRFEKGGTRASGKFLLSYLPVAVPLLVLGFSSIYIADSFVNKEIVAMTTKQLDYLKDSLELSLYELDALNLTLSSNKTVISSVDRLFGEGSMTMEDVNIARFLSDSLNAQINARAYVDSVYFFLDAYPDRFFSSMAGIVRVSAFPDIDWIESYKSMSPMVNLKTEARPVRKLFSGEAPRQLLTMYRRLYPVGNSKKGVIVMNMNKDFFDGLVFRALLFEGQEIYLLGDEGDLILGSGGRTAMSPLAASIKDREIDTLREEGDRDGRFYLYASRTSHYGWKIVSMVPSSALNSVPQAIRILIFVILSVSLLSGILLSYSISRRNAKRLAEVVKLFENADEGGELPEIPEKGNDEYDFMVQTLIRTFLKQRYASLQLSERRARAELLELQALRAQMNPHFLFNTLETLYWMVYGKEGRPSPASTAVKDLSALLKYSLENSELVQLAEEAEVTDRYISIQRLRYQNAFSVEWSISDDALDCRVPKLIFQPLIENVIHHGLGDEPCLVEIGARIEKQKAELLLWVKDDGAGMRPERLAEVEKMICESEHPNDRIGLRNTNRRISLAFGPNFGLSVSSEPGCGTEVRVRLPVLRT